MGRLKIFNSEYWIKDGIELPSNFDSMNDDEKWDWVFNNNGLYHREDGPAVIRDSGYKIWCLNGKMHRIGGPAEIYHNGTVFWYLNDIKVDGEIYQKIQNSSKEELLVYMVDPEYRRYLPLIEHRLNQ